MKTLSKIFIIACLIGCTVSCSNDLNEKVFSSVTEQSYSYTAKDFYPVIGSVYPPLRNICSHGGYFAQEITADIIVMPPQSGGWDDGGVYRRMHYHLWNSEQAHVSAMWNWFYQGALLCNNVIEQIEKDIVPAPSPVEKEQCLAEVRAVRAYYYWMICDNYGDAPLITSKSSDLPEKSSRQDIYKFIVDELTEVIPKLNEEQGGRMYGRINKWAGKALLANVYLNAEIYTGQPHWTECITQCDDIINSGQCALEADYNASFRAHGVESSKEVLFTVPFDKTLAGGNYIHMYSWHAELKKKYLTEATPWGAGAAMGITQFIDTYDSDDSRLEDSWLMGQQFGADGSVLVGSYDQSGEPIIFTKEVQSGNYRKENEGYRMNKYEIEAGCPNNSTTDIPLFRYAQVLLMKAECLLRTQSPGAGSLVSQVRQRAFKSDPSKATVTDAQLQENSAYQYGYVENYVIVDPGNQDAIQYGRFLDELGWEFAWEMTRRRDIIRFGVFTKKSWMSHKPQGDYRTVFPIPESAITSNPNLVQNPNYVK